MHKKSPFCFILFLTVFYSCVSSGDTASNNSSRIFQSRQINENIIKMENAIVPLEASGTLSSAQTNQIEAARQLLAEIEEEEITDTDFSGQLIAMSGRLAAIEGRTGEAVNLQIQSNEISNSNIQSIILKIRLETDPARRLEIINEEITAARSNIAIGNLNIEKGRTLYELNRFAEAVSAFDSAFASGINLIYTESYTPLRTRAFELRNFSGITTETYGLINKETITWAECISIIRTETQLLQFISSGRNVTTSELFNRLLDRTYIPYSQDITTTNWPLTKPSINETVTRSGAAYFIWHLYMQFCNDRRLLSRYSAIYARGENPQSPIEDVPVLSQFFDSIMGCTEMEFLMLSNKYFYPTRSISVMELLTILHKITG